MGFIPPGESETFELIPGIPAHIRPNIPIDFRIETAGGSIIEGKILPDAELKVISGGDITKCDFDILGSLDGLELVD